MKKIILVSLLALLLTSFVAKKTDYSFVNADKTIKIALELNKNKTQINNVFYK